MDKIERITQEELNNIISGYNFNAKLMIKDYYLTLILYLIKDIECIYFKGGTALNKIFLSHARLSEDIDFTITCDVKEIQKEITKILKDSGFLQKLL